MEGLTFSPRAIEAAASAVANARSRIANGSGVTLPSDRMYAEAALSAALAVDGVALQGWQPIESAPHETNVLLAYWDEALGDWLMEAGMASWGWRRNGVSNMSQHGQATHWQPLPPPPAASDREERRPPPKEKP
jgi:hypothetical protein